VHASASARFEVGRTQLALAELAGAQAERAGAMRPLAEARRIFDELGVESYVIRARALADS
jgi:hypothetical protein